MSFFADCMFFSSVYILASGLVFYPAATARFVRFFNVREQRTCDGTFVRICEAASLDY
jgi:hypothetical protein